MRTRVTLALMGVALSACSADLTMPWEIAGPHLYGARVEVVEEPSRATPAFGESFVLHQYVVGAEELTAPKEERFDMKLAACVGLQAPNGALICAKGIDLEVPIEVVSGAELVTAPIVVPAFDLVLPTLTLEEQELLGQINQVAIVGAVCVQGTAERVPGTTLERDAPSELFRCNSRPESIYKEPLAFLTTVSIDNGEDSPNHNPSFACDPAAPESPCNAGVAHEGEMQVAGSIVLVGPKPAHNVQAWDSAPADLPPTQCKGNALPQVHVGSGEHLIRVRLDPSDREAYTYQAEEYGKIVSRDARELIQVSHSLSEFGGKLERYTSVVRGEDEDAAAEIEVAYTPPKKNPTDEGRVPEGGRVVRFSFALRDFRGGFDFTTRALCLLPPVAPGSDLPN